MVQGSNKKADKRKILSAKEKEERKQRILELHNEGMTPKEIAYEIGRSMSLVYNVLSELRADGEITEEKLFEHPETRDAVIMYMINRRYTDRDIGQFLGVSANAIRNVRGRKQNLTDEEINRIIEEKSDEVELANARYVKKKLDDNEKTIIEMLQNEGSSLEEIAKKLKMSMNGLRKVIDRLVFQRKIDPQISTKAIQEYMNDVEWKRKFGRKKYNPQKSPDSEVKKCRRDMKLLMERIKSREISEEEKNKCYELCRKIVKSGERLTLEEIETLSNSIAYGEGEVNLEAIKFISNEYAKAENLRPALRMINNCIAVHGDTEKLEEARGIVLNLYKKQAILICLRKNFSVEETMARVGGASENEVREIESKYIKSQQKQEETENSKKQVEFDY